MRALAVAALVPVLAGSARAEDTPPGLGRAGADAASPRAAEAVPEAAPWFLGASVSHGRITHEFGRTADGTTFAAEGGRFLGRWLSTSLSLGLGRRHGTSDLLGPLHAAAVQDLTLGPRLSVTPLRGRIRFGFGIGVLRHRVVRSRPGNASAMVTREVDTYTELHAGVVPLRRGRFELELGATAGSAGTEEEGGFDQKTWYTVGVGLRWYTAPRTTADRGRPGG